MIPAVAALTVLGCAKKEQGSTGAPSTGGKKIKIGFIVKQPDEPWFQNEWKFAEQAADKYGFEVVKIGATDGSKVLSGIDNLGAQGAKGLVICAPDVRLGPGIVQKCKEYGIKVMAVDDQLVDASGKPLDIPYMGISAYDIGKQVGTAIVEEAKRRGWDLKDPGIAACAPTFPELETGRQRIKGASEVLITAGFPAERIYTSPNKTGDTSGGFSAGNIILTQHPDIKKWLVFSTNDEGVMGAVRAMENRGFDATTILGVGIGGSTALSDFEKPKPTGVYGTVLIDPKRHGYETCELMYKWITEGKEPPKVTLTTGTLITRKDYKKVMSERGLL